MKNLVCPISEEKINEKVTRLNAFFTILLLLAGFAFNSVIFLILLLSDFIIRAFTNMKYSPVGYFSLAMATALRLPQKSIDKAPKIFAARLGFVILSVIFFLIVVKLKTAAFVAAIILAFFAGLEFLFSICVGCLIYTYFIYPFYRPD